MKKLIFLIVSAVVVLSCNSPSIEFDNYEEQSIYFPIQYPIRTISLGNDLVDNSLDKEHKFNIGVCVGGYYDSNDRDWQVHFDVDFSLVPDNCLMRDAGMLKILPSGYYTLTPNASVTIPKGSFNGLIQVQLNDAFFQDTLAITGRYVIPLRITGSPHTNNILHGQPSANAPANPDVNNPSDWDVLPKDYTLFGIKYVNPYHGKWLRRGMLTVRDQKGQIVDTKTYHAQYVEQDEVVSLTTVSLNAVTSVMNIDTETLNLKFDIDDHGEIIVSSLPDSPVTVVYGTGLYKENGDTWGGTPENPTPRDAIYVNYFYKRTSNANTFVCEVSDTLVFRDRAIAYEDVRPTIVTP